MSYEKEIRNLLGADFYDSFINAVDEGKIGQKEASDIATKLHPLVGGRFKQAYDKSNFTFDRRAMRQILSDWHQYVVPSDTAAARAELIGILKGKDLSLCSLAADLEKLAVPEPCTDNPSRPGASGEGAKPKRSAKTLFASCQC